MTGIAEPRQASASPSTLSESCHMTVGCSGFPKLRQLTTAEGRAPTHARFAIDSASTSATPPRGSSAHARGFESVEIATPRLVRQPRPTEPEQGGVAAGADDRVQEELVVVLAVDRGGVGDQREEAHGTSPGAGPRSGRHRAARRGRRGAAAAGRSGGPRRRGRQRARRRGSARRARRARAAARRARRRPPRRAR